MASATPWYEEQSPEIGGAFADFLRTANREGVLDKKTKELLMTALACVFRCPHCTEEHIRGALEAGATKQEVAEALLIAALEGAGTQLAWAKDTFREYLSGD
jgi:AhpD family alkylhydroperoxidase